MGDDSHDADDPRDESNDEHENAGTDPEREHGADRESEADGSATEDDHWLSSLLTALEALEGGAESLSGRRKTDRTILDYDVSIRSGDGIADDRSPPGSRPSGDGADRSTDRPRKRRRYPGDADAHHLTTRTGDDELLVTADVGGTDPDEVTVGFDDSTLVVAVSGREVDRVDVPWAETTADATIKNGVLTVQIRPESASNAGPEGDR